MSRKAASGMFNFVDNLPFPSGCPVDNILLLLITMFNFGMIVTKSGRN